MISFESPHRGDSNKYTQYTIFDTKKKKKKKKKKRNSPQIILNLQLWDFSKELKNDFETAVVNELSVFEPLTDYCMCTLRTLYTCLLKNLPNIQISMGYIKLTITLS